jgi:hypothetical protein
MPMSSDRGARHALLLGQELKSEILSSKHSLRSVCRALGTDMGTFGKWCSGEREIRISVVVDACEVIGIDPCEVVKRAYDQLIREMGPPTKQSPTGRMGRPPKATR